MKPTNAVPTLPPGQMGIGCDPATEIVRFHGKASRFAVHDSDFDVPWLVLEMAYLNMRATALAKYNGIESHINVSLGAATPGQRADSVHGPGISAGHPQ
jgi:hypothetical protein